MKTTSFVCISSEASGCFLVYDPMICETKENWRNILSRMKGEISGVHMNI